MHLYSSNCCTTCNQLFFAQEIIGFQHSSIIIYMLQVLPILLQDFTLFSIFFLQAIPKKQSICLHLMELRRGFTCSKQTYLKKVRLMLELLVVSVSSILHLLSTMLSMIHRFIPSHLCLCGFIYFSFFCGNKSQKASEINFLSYSEMGFWTLLLETRVQVPSYIRHDNGTALCTCSLKKDERVDLGIRCIIVSLFTCI